MKDKSCILFKGYFKPWQLQVFFLCLQKGYLLSKGWTVQELGSRSLLFSFISPFETALCRLPAFNKIEDAVQD